MDKYCLDLENDPRHKKMNLELEKENIEEEGSLK